MNLRSIYVEEERTFQMVGAAKEKDPRPISVSTSALHNLVLVSNPMSLDLQITARLPATTVAGNQLNNDLYLGPSQIKNNSILNFHASDQATIELDSL